MDGGIYQIVNIVNGKKYIGSTVKFKQRWYRHKMMLKNGSHHAKQLQNSWNKHGENAFKFEILLTCKREELIEHEQAFIDKYKPEYNICPIAQSSRGRITTDETKEKLAAIRRGYVLPKKVREKISHSHKGKKMPPISNEHRKKLSIAATGRKHTEESRAKMRGRIFSEEALAKFRSLKHTEEIKKRIGAAQKGKIVSLETRAKISAAHLKRNHNTIVLSQIQNI